MQPVIQTMKAVPRTTALSALCTGVNGPERTGTFINFKLVNGIYLRGSAIVDVLHLRSIYMLTEILSTVDRSLVRLRSSFCNGHFSFGYCKVFFTSYRDKRLKYRAKSMRCSLKHNV